MPNTCNSHADSVLFPESGTDDVHRYSKTDRAPSPTPSVQTIVADNTHHTDEHKQFPDDIVTWDSNNDPKNPRNWPHWYKAIVTLMMGLTTMCATFASSSFNAGSKYSAKEFRVSREVMTLGISLFLLGFVPGPIIFGPFSEMYGRKYAVIVAMFVFICLSAATATAKDIQTVMLTRFFAGMMGASPVVCIGGGLADMYPQKTRGTAVVFYSLSVISGPTLGPIIGGAAAQSYLGWRWTENLLLLLLVIKILVDIFFLPETYAPVLLVRKARELRLKTGRWGLHSKSEMKEFTLEAFFEKSILRPLKMVALDPVVFGLTLYSGFAYGIMYMLFAAIPIVYEEHRHWNTLQGGLAFLAVMVGNIASGAINLYYSQCVFLPHVNKFGHLPPEKRLPPMMIGSISFPVGFFILGWTSERDIFWFPSLVGLFFIGMSFLLIFQSSINYLLDAYTKWSASSMAANTFMRSAFGAALPLVARPLYHNLGVGWACNLLGFIAVGLAGIPFLFYFYGAKYVFTLVLFSPASNIDIGCEACQDSRKPQVKCPTIHTKSYLIQKGAHH
ncbi:hypothetical protein M422DRAFT_221142 [Sphaerobolus stellatus SS14]|nr:hypothetical protein M422DRAFT_221142 [Sphaerobolus stellatus SS14]